MLTIKKLKYEFREEDGVYYAEPEGLKYLYFIYPPNKEKLKYFDPYQELTEQYRIEIIPIDEDFTEINNNLTIKLQSMEECYAYNQNHFEEIINRHLNFL